MRSQGAPRLARDVLLFDLVGTLIDESSDYAAVDEVFAKARQRFRLRDAASTLSGDFSLALMEILRAEGEARPGDPPVEFVPFETAAKDVFAAVLEVRGVEATEEDVAWFWSTFVDGQRRLVRPHKDAVASLRWAKEHGYRVFVVTDADPYFVRDVVPHAGLAGLIDGHATAAEAGSPKPEEPIFRLALQRAKVPPVRAIMVGDSYERDVQGARAAGIHRCVLLDRHRARTVDDVPVITSLEALQSALSRLSPSLN